MRLRYLGLGCLLLGGGCLVPRYDYDPSGTGGNGGSGGAVAGGSSGSVSGGSAGASVSSAGENGGGSAGGGSAGEQGCNAEQKACGGECVALDDPAYGCTPSSCDASSCPVAGEGTLACEAGACVVGSCGAGSKKCDGKCVALDDPTYGCSETSCDASACPDAAGGTVICNQGACEIGTCTADTKACDGKCVPKDRNNGCNDPTSCQPCTDTESCGTENAACECYATDPCQVLHCGEATDRCGKKWQCGECDDDADVCHQNYCVECASADDCAESPNECLEPHCTANNSCNYRIPTTSTPCFGGGTCSTEVWGACEHAAVSIGGGNDIDRYEVTRAQYWAFVEAMNGQVAPSLPAVCNFKTSHGGAVPSFIDDHLPATRVDWCDAYAYCQYVGRRLCGKPGGGATPHLDWNKPASSQWMKACQGPSLYAFPYGNTAQAGVCHDNSGPAEPRPVGSFPMCEGGYQDVFDMSGNVMEWEDGCNGTSGGTDDCLLRGGSYSHPGPAACADFSSSPRDNDTADNIGFRCCSK